jgi:CheY-like chemotaxis protein
MLKLLRRLLGEDIDLAWVPGLKTGSVTIDPSQLDQILANLCVNARDAIAGVGKLTIETDRVTIGESYCLQHADARVGEFVMLAVSDSGCGMSREVLDHLFEPFFTTKDVGQGTGLGLATVYGIVKQNEGFINVYSEPGQGTTFKIYLPGAESVEVAEDDEEASKPPVGGTETLLLVEDEKSVRALEERFLKALGYDVIAAENPKEALRLVAEHKADIPLLVTDVVMPGMSGRDLSNRLRELRPAIRTLYMSGYTANVIAHQGVLDVGVEFLQKPVSLSALAAKIRQMLDAD